jgi:hypothetical protein
MPPRPQTAWAMRVSDKDKVAFWREMTGDGYSVGMKKKLRGKREAERNASIEEMKARQRRELGLVSTPPTYTTLPSGAINPFVEEAHDPTPIEFQRPINVDADVWVRADKAEMAALPDLLLHALDAWKDLRLPMDADSFSFRKMNKIGRLQGVVAERKAALAAAWPSLETCILTDLKVGKGSLKSATQVGEFLALLDTEYKHQYPIQRKDIDFICAMPTRGACILPLVEKRFLFDNLCLNAALAIGFILALVT